MLRKQRREKSLVSCKGSVHKKIPAVSLTLSRYFPLLPGSSETDLVSVCTAPPSSLNIQLKCRKEGISVLLIWNIPSPLCSVWKAERQRKRNSVVSLSPRYCLPLVAKFLRQTHAWLETCLFQRGGEKNRKREGKKRAVSVMHVLTYCMQNKCDNTNKLLHYLQRINFGNFFFPQNFWWIFFILL